MLSEMDMAGQQRDAQVKRYNRVKYILGFAEFGATIAMLYWVSASGFSWKLARFAQQISGGRWIVTAFMYTAFGLCVWFTAFIPFSWYRGYVLEKRFCLSNQTMGQWFMDWLKGCMVGFVFSQMSVIGLFWAIRHFHTWWWLIASVMWLFFSLVLAKIAPLVLIPIFYTLKPIDSEKEWAVVKKLAVRLGMRIIGMYEIGFSVKTKKANAALTGLGSTKRILLSDTLREHFTPEETASVIAHEFGHYAKRHLIIHVFVSAFFTMLTLFIGSRLYTVTGAYFRLDSPADIAGLPVLMLYLTLLCMVVVPCMNWISRRHEREADLFAAEMTDKAAFSSALKKLTQLNYGDPSPHPYIEFFLYSHPCTSRRIRYVAGING